MRILTRLADLRITVTLFALSLFLVFYGTLAQVDKGVWTVVSEYFRSPVVWIPLKTVFLLRGQTFRAPSPTPAAGFSAA